LDIYIGTFKVKNMLSEKVYTNTAEEFSISVGVARITGYKKKTEHIDEVTPEVYKNLSNQLDINWIITETILDGNYKELQREIYRLKQTNKRLKSELSIYKRAFKNINGNGNINITKPTKVHAA
jgi:hypothetical protein